jgi:hypothetical protein
VSLLRSWTVLTLIAIAGGDLGSILVGVGPKIAAEPELARTIVVTQIALFTSLFWVPLAVIRSLLVRREKQR